MTSLTLASVATETATPAVKTSRARTSRKTDVATANSKNPSAATRKRERARADVVKWAHRYTAGAVVLSAGLNAWASVQAAGATGFFATGAAVTIGAVVPVGVWILSKTAGHLVRAGWRRMAGLNGAVACFLLALSLWHCSAAISGLTGTEPILAWLLAIGIDCGLVSSEVSAVLIAEE